MSLDTFVKTSNCNFNKIIVLLKSCQIHFHFQHALNLMFTSNIYFAKNVLNANHFDFFLSNSNYIAVEIILCGRQIYLFFDRIMW